METLDRIQILVVDDNQEYAELLKEIIEDHTAFLVITCKSGIEALKYLDRNHHLILGIISDVMMAGLDGIEFLGKIRADSRLKDIPLIFLSGTDPKVFENLLAPFGFTSFLAKPIQSNKLIQALRDRFVAHSSLKNRAA